MLDGLRILELRKNWAIAQPQLMQVKYSDAAADDANKVLCIQFMNELPIEWVRTFSLASSLA
jgi:hypothetical protein